MIYVFFFFLGGGGKGGLQSTEVKREVSESQDKHLGYGGMCVEGMSYMCDEACFAHVSCGMSRIGTVIPS